MAVSQGDLYSTAAELSQHLGGIYSSAAML